MYVCIEDEERATRPSYQWMVTLFWTWLTTLTTTRSPSLAMIGGPGNRPFTLKMLFVWHNLVTFCSLTYERFQQKVKQIKTLSNNIKPSTQLYIDSHTTKIYIELVMPSDASTSGKLGKEPENVQKYYEHDSENCR